MSELVSTDHVGHPVSRDHRQRDAAVMLQAMTARLRDDVQLDRVAADVLGVVDRTFHPASASLWLR